MKELNKIISDFEKNYNARVVYLTKSGSKLYGTDTENSDTDYKGIFIPSKKSVLLKKDKNVYVHNTNNSKTKNSKEDVDLTLHSVYEFFNHLLKSETGSIDILFSMWREDTIEFEDEDFTNLIKSNYKTFLNSNMKSFIGYALGQTKKFGIKGARYDELDSFVKWLKVEDFSKTDDNLGDIFNEIEIFIDSKELKYIKFMEALGPRGSGDYKNIKYVSVLGKMFEGRVTLEYFMERIIKLYNQFGNRTKTIANTVSKTDFKALSHSLRIALEVKELLETDFIKFPLKDRNFIRSIKEGKENPEDVIEIIQETLEEVDVLLLKTNLPKEVNREEIEKLLIAMIFLKEK